MNFLCIYLGEGKGGGGCTNACICMGTHSQPFLQNHSMDINSLGRDEVLMVTYKCCCFLARSVQGRIQGGAKIGHGGPLLQHTSSLDWEATATNRVHF